MGLLFISYRREDSFQFTARLYQSLVDVFGKRHVFLDVRSIPPGRDFEQFIDKALSQTEVQIVVIGTQWLTIADELGNLRLQDPADLVRHEIEIALRRGIEVIPVLVNGAQMPLEDALPESIRGLAQKNAIRIEGTAAEEHTYDAATRKLISHLIKIASLRRHAVGQAIVTRLATVMAWTIFLAACIGLVGTGAMILGILSWPPAVSVLIHQYPAVSLLVSVALLISGLSSLINLRANQLPHDDDALDLQSESHGQRRLASLVTSSVSAVLFVALLATVLSQPAWCRAALTAICPSPPLVSTGVHDSALELYVVAVESGTFEIVSNPRQFSLETTPTQQIGAVRIDTRDQSPYKVVVGVHDLQQGRFGLIIEQVAIVVDAVPPSPRPLNVWTPGAPLDYRANPYVATYWGQNPNAVLQASYVTIPDGKVQLAPGESDQLDIQLTSHVPADVLFHVEVTYKSVIDPTPHILVLPHRFEVVFSDASNWNMYAPDDTGHFAPTH